MAGNKGCWLPLEANPDVSLGGELTAISSRGCINKICVVPGLGASHRKFTSVVASLFILKTCLLKA